MAYKILIDKEVETTIYKINDYYKKRKYNKNHTKKITMNIRHLIKALEINPYQYPIDSINSKFHKVVFTNCNYKINYYIDELNKTIYITNLKSFKQK